MQAYLNDSKLKTATVASMEEHVEADRLRKGSYGEDLQGSVWFRGCFIGCAVESVNQAKGKNYSADDHASFEPELGIPEWLARLIDKIFERLPQEAAQAWPVRFLEAVPVGADLETVKKPFLLWLMERNRALVEGLDISDELKQQVLEAIDGVVVAISDGDTDADRTAATARAARAARAAAGRAAVVGAAARVATAAYVDVGAARAADAAADAYAYAAYADSYAAYADAYVSIADKLIDLTQWRVARDGES